MPSSLRVIVVVRTVSRPFDAGSVVEVKLSTDPDAVVAMDVYLRVSPERAKRFTPGDSYTLRVDKI